MGPLKYAGDRDRTSTWKTKVDFESTASTIPPRRHGEESTKFSNRVQVLKDEAPRMKWGNRLKWSYGPL